jgi:hypothetical protein
MSIRVVLLFSDALCHPDLPDLKFRAIGFSYSSPNPEVADASGFCRHKSGWKTILHLPIPGWDLGDPSHINREDNATTKVPLLGFPDAELPIEHDAAGRETPSLRRRRLRARQSNK